jgi:hypothetical protein
VVHSSTPDIAKQRYKQLLIDYPKARQYLDDNIWPNCEQFMKAWTREYCTLGGMTTGRGEMMNRVCNIVILSKLFVFTLSSMK